MSDEIKQFINEKVNAAIKWRLESGPDDFDELAKIKDKIYGKFESAEQYWKSCVDGHKMAMEKLKAEKEEAEHREKKTREMLRRASDARDMAELRVNKLLEIVENLSVHFGHRLKVQEITAESVSEKTMDL